MHPNHQSTVQSGWEWRELHRGDLLCFYAWWLEGKASYLSLYVSGDCCGQAPWTILLHHPGSSPSCCKCSCPGCMWLVLSWVWWRHVRQPESGWVLGALGHVSTGCAHTQHWLRLGPRQASANPCPSMSLPLARVCPFWLCSGMKALGSPVLWVCRVACWSGSLPAPSLGTA